jgi:flagellar basal-body rod protein FlgG
VGDGFFKVRSLNSVGNWGYSRNGHFVVNKTGQLALDVGDGYELVPPITIPQGTTHIDIGVDGTISVLVAGETKQVGFLKLTRFINPEGLGLHGASIFTETEASGPPTEYAPGDGGVGQIVQGFLEKSNVDVNWERAHLRFLDKWRTDLLVAAGVSD